MVDGGDDVELELAITAGLKDAGVDLDLLYSGSVQLLESCYDTSFLASA